MEGKFQPLGDKVLIKDENNKETKTESGLILTEVSQRGATVQGEVIAIGTGVFSQSGERIPMTVQVGDTVLYKKDMGAEEVKIDGERYLLFSEHQLLGVLR